MLVLAALLLLACAADDSAATLEAEPIYTSGDCSETPRLEYPGMSIWQFEECYVEEADGVCVRETPSRIDAELIYNCDSSLVDHWNLIEIPVL